MGDTVCHTVDGLSVTIYFVCTENGSASNGRKEEQFKLKG